jgi:CheY-like chemotaxis protein
LLRQNGISTDERDRYINIIKTSGRSILKIVDDVLDLGRIETKEIELHLEEFPVTHFLNELYNNYKEDDLYKQKEKKIELRLNVNISSNTIIRTDKRRLKQILDNLIGNALKFTEEGFVEIGCRIKEKDFTENGWKDLLFFVKDSGIGIPKKLQDAVFEKFMKIEYDISKLYGGTGLGLTIAKKIVERLGGKIWLNSSLGEGSELYFTLPESVFIPAKQEPSLTTLELKGKYKWAGKTVLIVEDDEMSLIFLDEILKPTDIRILHAANGQVAIQMIKNHPEIDLVLMDIKLPEMDGFEATKEIRKIRKDLPVIAQTAYAMADDKRKSIEVGCSDYITKPVNRKLLLKTADKFLNP